LRNLHRVHILTVPFENLDILHGREIVLDPDALIRKVVERRRGGFCYELNGAFSVLLATLGFRVTLLSARVCPGDGSFSPEFDHLTLRVDLDEPWLADVGFGDLFIEPLQLKMGVAQRQGERVFRIVQGGNSMRLETEKDGGWKTEYKFTLQPRNLQEFEEMCRYHQTSPESHFTRKALCTRATPDGRITLSDMKLITTQGGKKKERVLVSDKERNVVLAEMFGVIPDSAC
jgi:N-hydroxyarylamine O-acetyltransferase